MKDTILTSMNFFFGLLGFIAVIGVFPCVVGGIVFLVTGLQNKDAKIKRNHVIWGIVLMALPPIVIVGTLVAFAFVNTIMGTAVTSVHGA